MALWSGNTGSGPQKSNKPYSEIKRDLIGYGPNPPKAQWPGGAFIAVQFVINYEEGGEHTVLNGDKHSEVFLNEVPGGPPTEGARNVNMETMYEYGSRAGFWRLLRYSGLVILRVFTVHHLNLTSSSSPSSSWVEGYLSQEI